MRETLGSFLTTILIAQGWAVAQTAEPSPPSRPGIGLVLEGGAALGLAHIGVIEWLEEHRIPVAYVAGTSMGGLVGGVYATGDSPAEIRTFVEGVDWDDVLRGKIPFEDLTYRRKEDAIEYPNSLEFGIKNGIRFPEGFNSGFQVGLLLDRVSLPYSDISSFDELPIPFACVATELVSSQRHVFRDGSLAQALRSTMSLPGIFTPVRTKQAIFVDGGLLDNLPVDVAKDMGASLTIAVHLQSRDLGPTTPLSSVGVLGQSISTVIAANELRSMEMADILISVPLTKYSPTDYKKYGEIIQEGYKAAAGKAAVLSAFSVDEGTWQKYLAQRHSRRRQAPTPQFVEVVGAKPRQAKQMEHQLASEVGKPVDPARLDRQLTSIAGDQRYSRLGYSMAQKNDEPGLQIRADEKEYGPPTVLPLVYIDGGEYKNVQIVLGARITYYDLGGADSEWRNDIAVGSEYGLASEYYHPFGDSHHWFVAPRGFASNTASYYYKGSTETADYRNRLAGGAFDLGYTFNHQSELRIGYEAAYQKFSPQQGFAEFGTLQGRVGITSLRFNYIDQDDPVIPRRGLDVHFSSRWTDANPGAPSGFAVSQMQVEQFKPVSKLSSVFAAAEGGTTYSYHQTGLPPFSLGGNLTLLAYGENEFLTNQYYLFKAGYLRQLHQLPPILGDKLYVLVALEGARVFDIPNVSPWPADGYGGLIVNTLFGPVLLGGGYGATGHRAIFFRLGRVF